MENKAKVEIDWSYPLILYITHGSIVSPGTLDLAAQLHMKVDHKLRTDDVSLRAPYWSPYIFLQTPPT